MLLIGATGSPSNRIRRLGSSSNLSVEPTHGGPACRDRPSKRPTWVIVLDLARMAALIGQVRFQ